MRFDAFIASLAAAFQPISGKNTVDGYPGLNASGNLVIGEVANPQGVSTNILVAKNTSATVGVTSASDTVGHTPGFIGYRAGGTLVSPTSVQNGDILWYGYGYGYGSNIVGGGGLSLEVASAPSGNSFNTAWSASVRSGSSIITPFSVTVNGIEVSSGKKIILDKGVGNSYLTESGGVVSIWANSIQTVRFTNTLAILSSGVKLALDGSLFSDTNILESSANVLDVNAGGTRNIRCTSNGAYVKNRVVSYTSDGATPNIDVDVTDQFVITGQTGAITGITWSGTPYSEQPLLIHVTSTNTGIVFDSTYFEGSGTHSLTQSLTAGVKKSFSFTYNAATSKYRLMWVS